MQKKKKGEYQSFRSLMKEKKLVSHANWQIHIQLNVLNWYKKPILYTISLYYIISQFPTLARFLSGLINWTSTSPNVVTKMLSIVRPWYYTSLSYWYLFLLKETVLFCYCKNQHWEVQIWVEFGRLIFFNTKASDLNAQPLHEGSIAIKKMICRKGDFIFHILLSFSRNAWLIVLTTYFISSQTVSWNDQPKLSDPSWIVKEIHW